MKLRRSARHFWALGLVALGAISYCLAGSDCSLLTPDQKAYRLLTAGDYEAAVSRFTDPMWQGVALFRQGEFEQAAGVFAGFDTAEAAFNQGNALVMLGRYDQAVARYQRALELRPDWQPAQVNRDIARARAAQLAREGGEGTGGRLGADEIVFSDRRSPPSPGSEQTDSGDQLSDQELRSIWLRQVQTRPADFLRAKFAYQYARRASDPGGTE
jgi:Ca-activated chloride channel family protein